MLGLIFAVLVALVLFALLKIVLVVVLGGAAVTVAFAGVATFAVAAVIGASLCYLLALPVKAAFARAGWCDPVSGDDIGHALIGWILAVAFAVLWLSVDSNAAKHPAIASALPWIVGVSFALICATGIAYFTREIVRALRRDARAASK